MLQFLILIAALSAFGTLLKAALAASIWLYALVIWLAFACGWTLQTDAEKADVKAWLYKWL